MFFSLSSPLSKINTLINFKKSPFSASYVGKNIRQYESSSCYLNKLSQYVKYDVITADDVFCVEIKMITAFLITVWAVVKSDKSLYLGVYK